MEFIRRAADDPDVVAVKQTVYRTGASSELMEALLLAARRGKEVTVVVELFARFDEEANINWAEKLEYEGAQVVYGVFGLKTHAKLALLLRREGDAAGQLAARARTRIWAPATIIRARPRLYSDFGLMTADPEICADVNEVFLHITSLAKASRMKRLLLAPFTMHRRVVEMIRREAKHAREGKPARIVAKMNALVEEQVIRALYAASADGVSDRPDRARRVRAAPRRARVVREHPRALDPRPLPRAPSGLAVRERRRGRRVARVGRLDGTQPVPAHRGRVSGARSGAQGPRDRRRARRLSADTCDAWELHADGTLVAMPAEAGRKAALRAGGVARAPARAATRRTDPQWI